MDGKSLVAKFPGWKFPGAKSHTLLARDFQSHSEDDRLGKLTFSVERLTTLGIMKGLMKGSLKPLNTIGL